VISRGNVFEGKLQGGEGKKGGWVGTGVRKKGDYKGDGVTGNFRRTGEGGSGPGRRRQVYPKELKKKVMAAGSAEEYRENKSPEQ